MVFKGLKRYLFILIACIAVLVYINSRKPNLISLSTNATILAFGDSLTQGVGASPHKDYPSQLAKILGHKVINAGISGETTTQGLKRFENVLNDTNPEAIILLEGGNDFLRNVPRHTTHQNLSKMITLAQSKNITMLLVSVPEKSLFLSDAEIYKSLAKEYNIQLLEDSLSNLLSKPDKKSDLIHLNDRGYHELALSISEQFNFQN